MATPFDRVTTALAGRYRIERELGRGGMAAVFLAEDLKHHRRVAIKVLDPEVGAAIGSERFLREIETVARLTHPHILPLFESGAADGLLYYVMPYVEGESLRDRLTREKQLPLEDALKIAREVADALSCAHSRGLVHRDIKPENILLEEGHAVLADFGVARAVATAGGEKLTATGISVGTSAYMSPEQASGGRDLDGRADLYSLGCVLYEMLAGVPPFAGATAESLAHQHLNLTPRPVTELRPAVPAAVAAALQRALAKTPADRFNPVAQFGEALGPGGTGTPVPAAAAAAASGPRSRRGPAVLGLAVVAIVALLAVAAWQRWGPFAEWLDGSGVHQPVKKEWILVAEFDGPPGDTTLATAARSLASAALDQSEILATVPRDQIQLALRQAGKPANTRVSADVARELAYRRAVRAVLEGEIQRIGAGYSVVLRVVDAESLKVVITERGSAKTEDALIPALGKLAEKLRRDLGERRSAIAATRPMTAVATPSFAAYGLYVRADRLLVSNEPVAIRTAVLLAREALALDPGLFDAWCLLGSAYHNLGVRDSSRTAWKEALRLAGRATVSARLGVQARLARADGDLEGSLAAFDRLLQEDPSSYRSWNSRAVTLDDLGRFAEALESLRRAETTSPVGFTPVIRFNEVFFLCELGRAGEARRRAQTLPGLLGKKGLIMAEIAACEWAAAESLAIDSEREPGVEDTEVPLCVPSALAGRGAFREAAEAYVRAERVGARSTNPSMYQNWTRRGRVLLTVMSAGAVPLPTDTWFADTTTETLLTRGLRAAVAGDRVVARRVLATVRARPERDRGGQEATRALLDAWVLGLDGRWSEVLPLLTPAASDLTSGAVGPSAIRWTLADGYERCGQRDSAAVWLERIASDPGPVQRDLYFRGAALSAAHHRLVLLYARMGRLADAERHLAVLERWWDRPDDIARGMLAEARAAVKSARGMARPEAGQASSPPSQSG